jgi:hypothetical protein
MAANDNVFLLRPSATTPDCIALSLVNSDAQLLYHFLITPVFDGYQLQDCPADDTIYPSIHELVLATPLLRDCNAMGSIKLDHIH